MKEINEIAYFIDFSIQEIPSIAYIAYETGGIIYTNSEITYNFIKRDHPKLNAKYFKSINEIRNSVIKNKVKVIIYPDYHLRYFKDIPGIKHVQVFHGTSDKIYDYRKDVLNYDLFFIPGYEAYNRYKKRGLLKNNTGVLIGYSKLDRVFKGELKRDEELSKLKLDASKKTVLYAPTWQDRAFNSSWRKFRLTIAMKLPENINLIVKLHPNIKRYKKDEVEEYNKILKKRKNAILLDFIPDIIPVKIFLQ